MYHHLQLFELPSYFERKRDLQRQATPPTISRVENREGENERESFIECCAVLIWSVSNAELRKHSIVTNPRNHILSHYTLFVCL